MSQVKDLAEQVIGAVKSYIAQSVANLSTRLEEFDGRLKAIPDWSAQVNALKTAVESLPRAILAEIPKVKDGDPGKDADPELVAKLVSEQVSQAVEAIPKHVAAVVAEEVTKAVDALPKSVDGNDGRNAYEVAVSLGFDGTVHDWMKSLDGKNGEPGTSVTPEQVLPELRAELQKAIDSIPIPKNGDPGKDSTVTADDFRTLFEAESVKALLDFERRAQDVLLKAIANIPTPKDGDDGLGFDDLEVIHDGERTFTLKFARGETVKEFAFKVPCLIDRGVYREGETYEKGDGSTWGGSFYIAQKDTREKPGTDDWRLAVKIGRQGYSAYDLAKRSGFAGSEREWFETLKGEPGKPGKPGRDLTQMLHDGTKF